MTFSNEPVAFAVSSKNESSESQSRFCQRSFDLSFAVQKMSEKIFFFHNPKAGGASLRRILESRFPAQKWSPLVENTKVEHDELGGDYARFRGYDVYAGHYGYDIFAAVNDGHARITNFRHPATRLISLYNFFRFSVILPDEELRTDRFYAVLFAKSVSFERFVSADDPRVDVYVRNWHFRQLSNSCWSLAITKKFDEVRRFIDAMRWFYICEYPELSARWLGRSLNWDLDRLPRENVTGEKDGQTISLSALDERTYSMICKKNDLDFAIYQYAVDRLLSHSHLPGGSSGWPAIFRSGAKNLGQFLRRG